MTYPCEAHEAELSALLDGEVDRERLLPTLDHLVRCPACRSFYRRSRALDGTLALLREGEAEEPSPDAPWEGIRRRAGLSPPRRRPPAWAWPLAAGLLLAVGLAWAAGTLSGPSIPPPDEVLEVRVESERGRMSEERFLELTTELLRADRRYHLALEQVLAEVNRRTFGGEGSVERAVVGDEASRRPRV